MTIVLWYKILNAFSEYLLSKLPLLSERYFKPECEYDPISKKNK